MSTDVSSVPYLGMLRALLIPRNVTGQTVSTSEEPQILWSMTNQQEASWMYAQVSFNPRVPYLLVFEGMRAENVLGVIAVDDIIIFDGNCPTQPARATVGPSDCSFEFDMCGWRSVNPSSGALADLRAQDWRLADNKDNFGNIKDHTFNLESSGYVYFDTINIQTKTWLASPTLQSEASFCLQFWFAEKSQGSAKLVVKRQFNGTEGKLWETEGGTSRGRWTPVQVSLPSLPTQSVVIIEGYSGNGGFAIDDIKVNMFTLKSSHQYLIEPSARSTMTNHNISAVLCVCTLTLEAESIIILLIIHNLVNVESPFSFICTFYGLFYDRHSHRHMYRLY